MKVLEVIGCHSSVVRALVARVPGFDFLATTKIFSHFYFASFKPNRYAIR